MHFGTLLTSFLKGKFLISAIIGVALFSGATVAAFASPTGQQVLYTITGKPTVLPANHGHKDNNPPGTSSQECPGQPEAQHLATNFGLSSSPKSSALLTLCALHRGTFKGTSSQGTTVTSQRVLGYGEIAQVLTQAQQFATKAGKKLNDSNIEQFVSDTLQSCGITPLMQCLHSQPNENADDNGHGNNDNHSNHGHKDNGNSKGKSTLAQFP